MSQENLNHPCANIFKTAKMEVGAAVWVFFSSPGFCKSWLVNKEPMLGKNLYQFFFFFKHEKISSFVCALNVSYGCYLSLCNIAAEKEKRIALATTSLEIKKNNETNA